MRCGLRAPPPTAAGHRRLVARRWAWLVLVLLLTGAAVRAGFGKPVRDLVGLAVFSLCVYPLLLWVTSLALRRTARVSRILKSYPWRAYPCDYPRRAAESPKVIRVRFADDHAPVLRLTPFAVDLARKQNPSPDLIWFAGDPRYGGVISPVGGHFPVRVVPEPPGGGGPGGGAEADVLAERAELVKGGRVRRT
ncbi:hypothetical protein GCM10010232_17510 [Streptomyces amakusaensis]|uniref:hypothetical protein n=1 Tax=Streptomyces amakusaensis TaxID=67271 RepID=UPI0031E109B7